MICSVKLQEERGSDSVEGRTFSQIAVRMSCAGKQPVLHHFRCSGLFLGNDVKDIRMYFLVLELLAKPLIFILINFNLAYFLYCLFMALLKSHMAIFLEVFFRA